MGGIGSGGARQGAGRKTIDGEPRQGVSLTLPVWLLSAARDEADRLRLSLSAYITEKLEKGMNL